MKRAPPTYGRSWHRTPTRGTPIVTDARNLYSETSGPDRIKPELVLISAGFDAHAEDPVGDLGLEVDDFETLTKEIVSVAETHAQGRIVSVLEGGYSEDLPELVLAYLAGLAGGTKRGSGEPRITRITRIGRMGEEGGSPPCRERLPSSPLQRPWHPFTQDYSARRGGGNEEWAPRSVALPVQDVPPPVGADVRRLRPHDFPFAFGPLPLAL